jgi:hypothetical protein
VAFWGAHQETAGRWAQEAGERAEQEVLDLLDGPGAASGGVGEARFSPN